MLKEDSFIRKNLFILILLAVTGILITVTGILFRQAFLRILPLYISLFVMLLNSRVSRFGPLVGGINSLLYAVVYLHYGLYASAAYAVLVSCPFQIVTFIRWSKHPYENSTVFRRMTWKQRGVTALAFAAAWLVVCFILQRLSSNYMLLDTTTSLLGVLISLLTIFAYVEYTVLSIPSILVSICLYATMMRDTPEQITYLIYTIYAGICTLRAFFSARALYKKQCATQNNLK